MEAGKQLILRFSHVRATYNRRRISFLRVRLGGMNMRGARRFSSVGLLLFSTVILLVSAQSLSKLRKVDIQTGHEMVGILRQELPKSFIDPGFFGLDVAASLTTADGKLDKAQSLAQVYGIVAHDAGPGPQGSRRQGKEDLPELESDPKPTGASI
jgi:hypothetical protein